VGSEVGSGVAGIMGGAVRENDGRRLVGNAVAPNVGSGVSAVVLAIVGASVGVLVGALVAFTVGDGVGAGIGTEALALRVSAERL
jgi:hypothetical protein